MEKKDTLQDYLKENYSSENINFEDIKAITINNWIYKADILNGDVLEYLPSGKEIIDIVKHSDCIIQKCLEYTVEQRNRCCGKCTICREGLFQIESMLNEMIKPGSKIEAIEQLNVIGQVMKNANQCALGEKAAFPILSAIENFYDEMKEHCGIGECRSGKCLGFIKVYIDPAKCTGCGDCEDECPAMCIEAKKGYISMIDEFDCTKCGNCVKCCTFDAARFAKGRIPKLPDKLTKVGRFKK